MVMEIKTNRERQTPLLLITHGDQHEKQSFYSVLENQFHTTTIPILRNKRVIGSSYGWLVLVDIDRNYCCIWNPKSMEIIELPELKMSSIYSTCVLSKPPTEPDCHILFNCTSGLLRSFCRIGDDEFVEELFEPDDDVQTLLAVRSFQGKIYGFVGLSFRLVTVQFIGKTLELRPILVEGGQPWHLPIVSLSWVTWHRDYLIESADGELLLVHKMHPSSYFQDCCSFKIYRIDTNNMECVEIENIGRQTIFLSHLGEGFCCSSAGIKSNFIYYTHGERGGRNLYIYNLDDRSTTPLLPCPDAGRSQSISFWVETQVFN